MKKLLVFVVVVGVIGGIVWIMNRENTPEAEVVMEEGVQQQSASVDERVAELVDVSGGESSGKGYLTRGSEGIVHTVSATLPALEGSDFYEGWLVKKAQTVEFFSTGEAILQESGEYKLEYQSPNQWEGYDEVVITRETMRDEIPEEHILEGVLVANKLSLEEVAKHDKRDDCWIAIEGKVYDVTEFVNKELHPGGLAILMGCGKDATGLFNARPNGSGAHSDKAREMLVKYYLGDLE